MIFNSFNFLAFILVAIISKEIFPKKYNNIFLVIFGTYFYAFWSWFYTGILLGTVIFDWFFGLIIGGAKGEIPKKIALFISLSISVGILGFFKYGHFIGETFQRILGLNDIQKSFLLKDIILPVGISFYTFQSMAYVIDVYRGYKPVKNLICYGSYVIFFPQLVAGPIERASHLLPQLKFVLFSKNREWGVILQLILWGLFKKIVIADNLALFVDSVFQGKNLNLGTWEAIGGAVGFSIQIYGDFSGYTDIARGIAKLFGVDLTINFDSPYKSDSIQDFWRRWHISLSTWIRDYLYIPLGGNRNGSFRNYFNLLLTMMIAGLWHGASWMFVIWGTYHGMILVFERAFTNYSGQNPWSYLPPVLREVVVYGIVCMGWVLFRCRCYTDFLNWYRVLLNLNFHHEQISHIILVAGMGILMWGGGEINNFFKKEVKVYSSISVIWMVVLIVGLILFSSQSNRDFIYFQF
ncbi:MAG: MBOAT family O-acyltransferase [Verrucomicrobiota bacterium]